jgi:hypothetical protein
MKETLVESPKSHKPRYRLKEGRLGEKSGANRYANLLRQALATQLQERRNIQGMSGYASAKTDICTPTCPEVLGIIRKGRDQIQSPLDHLDLGDKRNGGRGVDTEQLQAILTNKRNDAKT